MRNILDQAKTMIHGAEVVLPWVGTDGLVVDTIEAQSRANVCLGCAENDDKFSLTELVALGIKKALAVKNGLELKILGEKQLHTCKNCGCCIRLLIWMPSDRVRSQMTKNEIELAPKHCWKLNA